MIESIFVIGSDREKHQNAPLLSERERYLMHLIEIGTRLERVRDVGIMLLHVVRILELKSSRPVDKDEISRGCERWVEASPAYRHRISGVACRRIFRSVATNWLRFQGALISVPKPVPRFNNLLSEFLFAMRSQHGLAQETLKSYQSQILFFLNWLESRYFVFSDVQVSDIEEYLEASRARGLSRNSVAAQCSALRRFFEYAERQRWCSDGIRATIFRPRVPRVAENLSGPPWEDVRHVIASIGESKPADLRAKAMFLLFSIYGLRSAEAIGLTLEDIDWQRGSMTVRRAKRGKTQQFPLQDEVGEAIAKYLEKARPKCSCRNLFVTLNPPYRPVAGHSMSSIIGYRVTKAGVATQQSGPHMLRRACATKLLRTGTSLQDIADFLGHSDLRSVSNYVKYDPASLKIISKFSLRGVL